MITLLDVSPVPPIGASELLVLCATCGLVLVPLVGGVGLLLYLRKTKRR